ncbi:hypothetical protein GCM10009117_04270 [Gangjinia marincola]|uniref:N-acetyltransferase domain-containing protein n=1 Tax=Gangjinia marincola TaxID=578463 RepID=A0ABP3XTI1_9FLAO
MAKSIDKDNVIRIVAETLKETPSAEETVKSVGDRDKHFLRLATHMVEKAIRKDALIISEDGHGVAIVFKTVPGEKDSLIDLWEDLKLAWRVIGIKKVFKILKKQKYVKAQRPADSPYLYCWFWGIDTPYRGAELQVGKKMKDTFFEMAEEQQLPFYADTRTKRNVLVYVRLGFEMFHEWTMEDGSKMWFLRYIPPSLKN